MIRVKGDEFVATARGLIAEISPTEEYAQEHPAVRGTVMRFITIDIDYLIDVLEATKEQLQWVGFELDEEDSS